MILQKNSQAKGLNMKHLKLFISILGICTFLNQTVIVNATSEDSTISSTESSNSQEESTGYFSDEDFEEFFNTIVENYENGMTGAMQELYAFITSGGCSYSQLHMVLEEGYFTEYIDEFKKYLFLEEDYELPEEVEVKETTLNTDGNEIEFEDEEVSHYLSEITSLDAQTVMVSLMNDDITGNAYVLCPSDIEDKTMNAQMIEVSAFTGDPLSVIFMNEDNTRADYTWIFSGIVYINRGEADLNVNLSEYSLDFDLGIELPSQATLNIYVGKDEGTLVNLKNESGNVDETLTVDEDGFISIPTYGSGHYILGYEDISSSSDETEIDTEKGISLFQQINPVSNLSIVILILIFTGLGAGFIGYGLARKIMRKCKKLK